VKSYFIDTNILMYAHGKPNKYKNACLEIMHLISIDKIFGIINAEVLQEIFYKYFSIGQTKIGIEMARNALDIIHMVWPIEKDDLEITLQLFKEYNFLNPRDSIHIASMIKNNVKEMISADRHFDKIEKVSRIDPLDFQY